MDHPRSPATIYLTRARFVRHLIYFLPCGAPPAFFPLAAAFAASAAAFFSGSSCNINGEARKSVTEEHHHMMALRRGREVAMKCGELRCAPALTLKKPNHQRVKRPKKNEETILGPLSSGPASPSSSSSSPSAPSSSSSSCAFFDFLPFCAARVAASDSPTQRPDSRGHNQSSWHGKLRTTAIAREMHLGVGLVVIVVVVAPLAGLLPSLALRGAGEMKKNWCQAIARCLWIAESSSINL